MNVVVTGAGGRVGRLLRHCWAGEVGAQVLWQSRDAAGTTVWDFESALLPGWPKGAVILHLAGVTRGSPADLAANVTIAKSLARAARHSHAAHVLFASSVAVYRPSTMPLDERAPPDPVSDYGRSKLAAEVALAEGLAGSGTGLTCLRIGNIAGADALLGGRAVTGGTPVTLDPVPGQLMGPTRSYIGPLTLARVLADLIPVAPDLPDVLNLAQPKAVAMGDLLNAALLPWSFGQARPSTVPKVEVDTARLQALLPLAPASAAGLVAELAALKGVWP